MNESPQNVLITTSPYTTLLYFLVTDLHKINHTAYFFIRQNRSWPQADTEQTHAIFPQSYFMSEPKIIIRFKNNELLRRIHTAIQFFSKMFGYSLMLKITKNFRWPFLNTAEIFAYDDSSTAKALIGKRDYTFLEEGLYIYQDLDFYAKQISLKERFKRFLYAPSSFLSLGVSPQAKRVILTGLAEIPKCYRDKKGLEVVSMPELWEKSEPEKKALIMKFFNLTQEDVEALRQKDIIIVDQPLAVNNNLMTKDEQAEMMRRILDCYDKSRVLLKTHYRNTINYRELFPDVMVWDKQTPMELLNLCGVRFSEAVTVNSTAALSFPDEVHITWLGNDLDNPCFSHLSDRSREIFENFARKMPLPERIKMQTQRRSEVK